MKKILKPLIVYLVITALVIGLLHFLLGFYNYKFSSFYNNYGLIVNTIIFLVMVFYTLGSNSTFNDIQRESSLTFSTKELYVIPASLLFGFFAGVLIRAIDQVALKDSSIFYQNFYIQLICFGIIIPICQQIIFTGVMYNRLRKSLGIGIGILIASIIIAIFGYSSISLFIYLILAEIFTIFIYETYERNILVAVVTHVLCNITLVLSNLYDLSITTTSIFFAVVLSVIPMIIILYIVSALNKHKFLYVITGDNNYNE